MGPLKLIGYWSGPGADGWPEIGAFVDEGWDPEEREWVVDYLRTGVISRTYMGYSRCRMCGRDNGVVELTDGVWVWPEGLAHYLDEHGVRLPSEFVAHVLAHTERLEQAERETAWWRSRTSWAGGDPDRF
ncbi:hypothetical protein ACQHIV_03445 [Kribbella sp. GL6]|uniref:hypothetical protein n=1 Tax=Kribbella sp. GL6 TaxID=3419765 RepID=UPI003D048E54